MTFPTTVTTELKTTIFDWFQFREVCDDEKFNVFFNRVLNRDLSHYNEMLMIENTTMNWGLDDWFLTHHGTGTDANTGTTEQTTNGTLGRTGTDTTTEDSTSKDTGDTKTDSTASSETHETSSDTDKTDYGKTSASHSANASTTATETTDKKDTTASAKSNSDSSSGNRILPQSTVYKSTAGTLPKLDWTYMSSQAQTTGNTTSSNTSTETGNGTSKTTESGTADSTITDGGSDTKTGSGKSDSTASNSGNTTTTNNLLNTRHSSIETVHNTTDTTKNKVNGSSTSNGNHEDDGTDGIRAELIEKTLRCIRNSVAWSWLEKRLEPCFIGVYEI